MLQFGDDNLSSSLPSSLRRDTRDSLKPTTDSDRDIFSPSSSNSGIPRDRDSIKMSGQPLLRTPAMHTFPVRHIDDPNVSNPGEVVRTSEALTNATNSLMETRSGSGVNRLNETKRLNDTPIVVCASPESWSLSPAASVDPDWIAFSTSDADIRCVPFQESDG